jgi:enoyl-CoA hydratase/carnithine racemase
MAYDTILYEKEDGAGIITMNRLKRRNAFSPALVREMTDALEKIRADEEIKAVIITGGREFFCSGMDLKEPSENLLDEIRDLNKMIENFQMPVIAAINGHCVAGGLEMAISCDLRIAAEDATLGLPEIQFGALAIGGATQRLPRLIGMGKAKELHFMGEPIDAQEAYRIGLANKIVPAASVMDEAKKMAGTLALRSRSALKMAKFLINTGMRTDLNTGMEIETEVSKGLFHTVPEEMKKAAERQGVYKKIFEQE